MTEEFLHIAPWALLTCAVAIGVLWLLLHLLSHRPAASLGLLVVVPLLAALGFVVAISGFMFTPQLGWTLVTCALIGLMLLPGSVLLGQQYAARALAAETRRAQERAREESHRDLIAWLSHDLRTPLAGITAMAEALEDGVVEEPADVKEYGVRIGRESGRLGTMVDDLFELSRISSGSLRLHPVPVALDELVRETANGLRPVAAARDVALEVTLPPVVGQASGREIERVVRNLLVNAVRHTEPGRAVTVRGGRNEAVAWLSVTDGCGGIPAEDLPRVFEVGFRGNAARSPDAEPLSPGAGLGLAVVRGLMAAQHGQVDVRNVAGGCCFRVTLPLAGQVAPAG